MLHFWMPKALKRWSQMFCERTSAMQALRACISRGSMQNSNCNQVKAITASPIMRLFCVVAAAAGRMDQQTAA